MKVGDRVHAGQAVALVGDNGYARMPHIHIGAWRGKTPYQIGWAYVPRVVCPHFSISDPASRLAAERQKQT